MTFLKIFYLDDTEKENVSVLSEGQHIIGRGVLNCHDKRVSRKHAMINISSDMVTIKALHVNPCFFKSANGNNITILPKDSSVVLGDGDQFAFLANLFWFKVNVIKNIVTNNVTYDFVKDVAIKKINHKQIPKIEATNSDIIMDTNHTSSRVKRSYNEESLVTKHPKICCEYTDSTSRQINTSFDESAVPSTSANCLLLTPHKVKTENLTTSENLEQNIDSVKLIHNLKTIVEEDYGNKNDKNESQKIKEENFCNENKQENDFKNKNLEIKANILYDATIESNIKEADELGVNNVHVVHDVTFSTENNQNKASCSTNDKNSIRERCLYGLSCYRKNLVHRADFSHPGDHDYDTDADDDRPLCPFKSLCYRTNLDHRRHYKHSDPPMSKPNNFNTSDDENPSKKHAKVDNSENKKNSDDKTSYSNPKKRKCSMHDKNTYCDNKEDSYDYEDPFIDDATSDEFELSYSDHNDSTDSEG